jgi:branched-chain amino acid transport system substrate-binding protein
MSKAILAAMAALATFLSAAPPASAQDSLYVPLFTYRTGPFSGSGILIANGMRDYLTMLNERDGGIGGVRLIVEECETGYDTKKGVECYEAVKDKKPVMVNPWSTGITLPLIPRAAVDKIPSCPWHTASRPRPTAAASRGSSTRPTRIGTGSP